MCFIQFFNKLVNILWHDFLNWRNVFLFGPVPCRDAGRKSDGFASDRNQIKRKWNWWLLGTTLIDVEKGREKCQKEKKENGNDQLKWNMNLILGAKQTEASVNTTADDHVRSQLVIWSHHPICPLQLIFYPPFAFPKPGDSSWFLSYC